jgi:flagellar motor switch protein FliG
MGMGEKIASLKTAIIIAPIFLVLFGGFMAEKRDIVVTAYGHNQIIDRLTISTFSNDSENANSYCSLINSLDLKENSWVIAKIVNENTPFDLQTFFPCNFHDVILKLDNRSVQKVIWEIEAHMLAAALKDANDDVKGHFFRNMSSRASQTLREDMERMEQISYQAVRDNQDAILKIVRVLADCGEIIIPE